MATSDTITPEQRDAERLARADTYDAKAAQLLRTAEGYQQYRTAADDEAATECRASARYYQDSADSLRLAARNGWPGPMTFDTDPAVPTNPCEAASWDS